MSKIADLTPAFVLHRKSFSDNSLIVDFFSLHQGRVTCIAQGVKKGKSRKAAILQPFIPLMINYSGRGDLKTLRECESVGNGHRLDGADLFSAYYINELLIKLLQKNETHETVFAQYAQLLKSLEEKCSPVEPLLRFFELNLLNELGYGLQLSHDAQTSKPLKPDSKYVYDPESGPVESLANAPGLNGIPVISGSTLLSLNSAELNDKEHIRESKELMRYVIKNLLGGYEFKSREFFKMQY